MPKARARSSPDTTNTTAATASPAAARPIRATVRARTRGAAAETVSGMRQRCTTPRFEGSVHREHAASLDAADGGDIAAYPRPLRLTGMRMIVWAGRLRDHATALGALGLGFLVLASWALRFVGQSKTPPLDLVLYFYPTWAETYRRLAAGVLPLWNPYQL